LVDDAHDTLGSMPPREWSLASEFTPIETLGRGKLPAAAAWYRHTAAITRRWDKVEAIFVGVERAVVFAMKFDLVSEEDTA
jgi:hypothetical protein